MDVQRGENVNKMSKYTHLLCMFTRSITIERLC